MKKPAYSTRAGGRQSGKKQSTDRQLYRRSSRCVTDTRPTFASLKARMRDQWAACLFDLAPALHPALARPGQHVACPVHGGKDGFRVFKDVADTGGAICNTCGNFADGFALIAWANSWTLAEALKAVVRWLGLDTTGTGPAPAPRPAPPPAPAPTADPERERRKLAAVWRSTVALSDPPAEPARRYLAARGLAELLTCGDLPLPTVARFHAALDYWIPGTGPNDRPVKLGTFPALVCRVQSPDGGGAALHLTYLEPDGGGKARLCDTATGELLPAKKLRTVATGATNGGAIRLYAPGPRLAVAEGIETALAVRLACPGLPVWATVSAGGMARLVWPAGVQELIILADHDESGTGERAARTLATRAYTAGVRARLAIPPASGHDWNDVLLEQEQEVRP